jgi:hypothetical protein
VELAELLRGKAAEQALPSKRDALLQLADALEQQAKDVMDRANELLRLPGDKPRQQKLDDAINKLKKTMQAALIPLQEDYAAACNAQKWTLEGSGLQQAEIRNTDPADKKRAIEELLEAVKAGDKLRIKVFFFLIGGENDLKIVAGSIGSCRVGIGQCSKPCQASHGCSSRGIRGSRAVQFEEKRTQACCQGFFFFFFFGGGGGVLRF